MQGVELVSVPEGSSEATGHAILQKAQQLKATLLAIAPHRRTASERVLKGSVTDVVLRWAAASDEKKEGRMHAVECH